MSDRLRTYAGGPLALSAVPGAGKTHMLIELAVSLVTERGVQPSELLVLTYMREAAEQLRSRLTEALSRRGHRAAGLTVTTIHAFCLGLLNDADQAPRRTLAESERTQRLFEALDHYLEDPHRRREWELAHPPAGRYDDPRRETIEAARQALSVAKLHGMPMAAIARRLPPDLAAIVLHYEAERQARGALDFDDQIREALALLETRPELLSRLRDRHRYILEDEAQDSTVAQARLLALLAGEGGHLVRVGDPNQAITSTFTASDPREFRAFCDRLTPAGRHLTIATSSRSGAPILAMANRLVALAARHPDPLIASALAPVIIAPAGRLNPPAATCAAAFHAYETADQERLGVLAQLRQHLARHPEDRVAVLLPTNREVDRYTELFSHAGLPVSAGAPPRLPAQVLAMLEALLRALASPEAERVPAIADAHDAWRAACGEPPREASRAWLLGPAFDPAVPKAPDPVTADFLTRLQPLYAARQQAPYPLLLTLGTALLPEGPAWEVLHRVAALAGDALPDVPAIEATRAWVAGLARAGGRDLLPPPDREGRLRLLTVHRAKGLEFDAVWLPNLGCQTAGRGAPVSAYPWAPEQVHLRGLKGLAARAALLHPDRSEDEAIACARQEAVAERLRLLYVGLTRARRHLVLSCHTHGGKIAPPWHIQALAACQNEPWPLW